MESKKENTKIQHESKKNYIKVFLVLKYIYSQTPRSIKFLNMTKQIYKLKRYPR